MRFVHEMMVRPAVTVHGSASLSVAAIMMLTHRLSGLPVVDEANRIVGVVTEGDFLRRPEFETEAINGAYWAEPFGAEPAERFHRAHGLRVEDVMSTRVVTVRSRDTLADAVRLMLYHEIKRLPVVDDGQLVGILSRFDYLRAFVAMRELRRGVSPNCELLIRAALDKQQWASKTDLVVCIDRGRVKLSGEVRSEAQRRAAIVLAEEVVGPGNVDAEIIVEGRPAV